MGARTRLQTRLAQLCTVRSAARAGSGAERAAARRATRPALAQGPFPARQSAPFQPQVLPELGAALRCLRAPSRPAARWDRGARGRGLPPVQRQTSIKVAAGLAL